MVGTMPFGLRLALRMFHVESLGGIVGMKRTMGYLSP